MNKMNMKLQAPFTIAVNIFLVVSSDWPSIFVLVHFF